MQHNGKAFIPSDTVKPTTCTGQKMLITCSIHQICDPQRCWKEVEGVDGVKVAATQAGLEGHVGAWNNKKIAVGNSACKPDCHILKVGCDTCRHCNTPQGICVLSCNGT